MKIDIKNYELYVIDYLDGNLSNQLKLDFEKFLEIYPDIKTEIDDLLSYKLVEHENLVFENKNLLKKDIIQDFDEINEQNYNHFFIAFYEGDLTNDMKQKVLNFVNLNPSLKQEFDVFALIKLEADETIVFKNKNLIKRNIVVFDFNNFITYGASVAAVLLIGITLMFITPKINFENLVMTKADSRNYNVNNELDSYVLTQDNDIKVVEYLAENIQVQKNPNNRVSQIVKHYNNDIVFKQMTPNRVQYMSNTANANHLQKQTEFIDAYDGLMLRNNHLIGVSEIENIQPKEDIIQNVLTYSEDAVSIFNKLRNDNQQLAKIGVEGVNRLTDRYNLYLKRNDEGDLTHLAINDFAIPLKRNR